MYNINKLYILYYFISDVESDTSRLSTIHQDTSFIDDDKTALAKHDALMY